VGEGGAPPPGLAPPLQHVAPRRRHPPGRQHALPPLHRHAPRTAVRIRSVAATYLLYSTLPCPWLPIITTIYNRVHHAVRIGAIYVLSGVGGAVLSSLVVRNRVTVGASGALLGLLGAMLSELLTNWTIYTNKAAAVATLLSVAAVNLVLGVLPHVDNLAHIGGFLAGFLLGFVVLMRPHLGWMERYGLPAGAPCTARKYLAYQWTLLAVAMLILVAG
jgi:hypothetical protein